MAIAKKERCAREMMSYCDSMRKFLESWETTKESITENGFAPGGSNPIADSDLTNLNLTQSDLVDAFSLLNDVESVLNGDTVTPTNLKSVLSRLKWW